MAEQPRLPAMEPMTIEPASGTIYPSDFAKLVAGRVKRRIGNSLGLKNFGINLVILHTGSASSQRHWHSNQDEFVYILEGEATLITDAGEQTLEPGMVAGFPAGKSDGHHLINKSDTKVTYLEVGDRTQNDNVDYPDIDMLRRDGRFVHKDGTPY